MMTKKEAKRQFKAFRKIVESRYDHMGTSQKVAGVVIAGLLIGCASLVARAIIAGECANPSEADMLAASA